MIGYFIVLVVPRMQIRVVSRFFVRVFKFIVQMRWVSQLGGIHLDYYWVGTGG